MREFICIQRFLTCALKRQCSRRSQPCRHVRRLKVRSLSSQKEIDVCESVLNGGWEALEQGRIDLIVGSPGPVLLQKGYRAIPLARAELAPVVASRHELASIAANPDAFRKLGGLLCMIHPSLILLETQVPGLSSDGRHFYVQNIDHYIAIMAQETPIWRRRRMIEEI